MDWNSGLSTEHTEDYQLVAASGAAISAEHLLEARPRPAKAFSATTPQTKLGAAGCYQLVVFRL